MELNWNVTEDEIDKARFEYTKECPVLHNHEKQTALWTLYAIERKNNETGLVLNLINKYTRDRILYKKESKTELTINEWVQQSVLIKALTKNEKYRIDLISAAITTFFRRFNNKIMFNTIERIQDSAEAFAKYIDDIVLFINELCKNKCMNKAVTPFQIDLWIKPKQIRDDVDEEKEEEDDDDDDDDDNDEDEDEQDEKSNVDYINIVDTLKNNKIIYSKYKYTMQQYAERPIKILFDKLMKKCGKKNGNDLAEFIHRNRFIMIIDRNNNMDEDKNEDEYVMVSYDNINNEITTKPMITKQLINKTQIGDIAYLFIPNKANKIPNIHFPEKYIQLSCELVLPSINNDNIAITARSGNTDFFMLSFHIEQNEEISCYQYQRAQISRFMPTDILDVWPYLFASCGGLNDEFFAQQMDEENKDNFVKDIKINHHKFDNFCNIDNIENNKQN